MAETRTSMADAGPGGMGTGERSKDLKKAFGDFFRYIGRYRAALLAAVLLSLAGAVLTLIGPGRLGEVTNLIQEGLSGAMDLPAIVRIASLLAVLYGLSFVVNYIQGFLMATVTQRITQSMRRDISRKINRLPLRYFDTHATGDTLSRVTNDVDTVGQSMNQYFSTLIFSLALLLGAAFMMLITNWVMALCGIAAASMNFFAWCLAGLGALCGLMGLWRKD